MDEIQIAALKRWISEVLGQRPRAATVQATADQLRSEAERLDRLAQALREESRKPPRERLRRRTPQAGPGATPGDFVRIERRWGKVRVHIGRALWYALGQPDRMDIQQSDATLLLIVAHGDSGFKCAVSNGAPYLTCMGAEPLLPPDGRYTAAVEGPRITVGQQIELENTDGA